MITRGQMALATNQHGYDVVSAENERISVKTVTTSTHVLFNKATQRHVDRVIVLRLNVEEGEASIEELLDCRIDQLATHAADAPAGYTYRVRAKRRERVPIDDAAIVAEAWSGTRRIIQYESGTVAVEEASNSITPVLPVLRGIAAKLDVSLLNAAGGVRNTRQLGAEIIASIGSSHDVIAAALDQGSGALT